MSSEPAAGPTPRRGRPHPARRARRAAGWVAASATCALALGMGVSTHLADQSTSGSDGTAATTSTDASTSSTDTGDRTSLTGAGPATSASDTGTSTAQTTSSGSAA